MTCPRCGTPRTPAQKFCAECGAALRSEAVAKYSPEQRIPRHLAEKILTSRTSLEGERKQVTILFADIKGSLELLADRDPEEARKLLDPVLGHMMDGVHRYEGTVNQVMGDGIMAIFGAPVAHEDHAIRACYAALHMQAQIARYAAKMRQAEGVTVQARIGINSGEVVVRSISSDLHMDYSAVGQTTHLAARMEQLTTPGSILITLETLRLAEGYVEVRSLGPMPVKGLAAPVEVFELTGASRVRSRLQAAAARGLTPFVGRQGEMVVLREAMDRAADGHGRIVGIVGEPGVGKSRLVREFLHSHHTSGWLVVESNSVSYGRATPYLPLIELLRNYFRIDGRDTTRSIREKVTGKILTLDPALQDAIAPVLDLLDALDEEHPFSALDALQHRQYTSQAITRLLLTESRVQPVCAVCEDLHWNDSLTLSLLNDLVNASREARLLLVVSFRPEYRDDDWQRRPNYHQLRLEPLGVESIGELLAGLLGPHASLPALKQFLMERSRGNPFFVEEIVRTFVDTGVLDGTRGAYRLARLFSADDVPPTVQAVLGARIDALPEIEKRLLQEAAVIGHDAPYALLHAISGLGEEDLRHRLANLQAAEFLYVTQLYPEPQYVFKHSLTHDVAYSGLLHERRRDIHARVVDAMEQLYADRLGEHVERLAHHAARGQLREKAIDYLRQAGAKAADRQAYQEAVALFEQALEALNHLPETCATLEQAVDLRFEIRNVLQPLGDRERIAGYLREAEQIAERLQDSRRIGWVQSYLTEQCWMQGRYGDAAVAGDRALAVAERLSDLPLQVVTNLPLGLAYHTRGDYRRAMQYFGWNATRLQGDQMRERFGMFVLPATFSRSFIAWGLAELGEFGEAVAVGEESLQIAEAAEHPFSVGYAHLGVGVVFLRQGDVRRALRSFERALAAGAFADSPVGYSYVAQHLGYALALAGRPDEGLATLEQTVRIAESKGFVARHALRLAYLGEASLIAGRPDAALAAATRALELARRHDERANEAYALRVLAEIELRGGKLVDAEGSFRASLAVAEELGMRPLQAHDHRGLAGALERRGDTGAAAEHRHSAMALVDVMHLRFWGDDLVESRGAA
jgi:class 3 adenylate cyclase/tetratricopeptide (TPR) repeat protein